VVLGVLDAVGKALVGLKYGSLYSNFSLDDEGRALEVAVKEHADIHRTVQFVEEFFLNYAHADEFADLTWDHATTELSRLLGALSDEVGRPRIDVDHLADIWA
jgi:hypothetical protein